MTTGKNHENMIMEVCEFIDTHIDENLPLDCLAEVSSYSKYHFHRVFKRYTGISAMQYILLVRMKRASFQLVFSLNKSITDIAFDARFDSHEAFSRAFSRLFSQSPSQFRSNPNWPHWNYQYGFQVPSVSLNSDDINIVAFEQKSVAALEHQNSLVEGIDAARAMIAWYRDHALSVHKKVDVFTLFARHPNTSEQGTLTSILCWTYEGEIRENPFGIKKMLLPKGKCAVYRHKGTYNDIGRAFYLLYQHCAPAGNEMLNEFPFFLHYVNSIADVVESELLTDVYMRLDD
ncbi:AraC family transcriptional regulator [Vibrio profundum]|uniref:AraC family transcriptional regulator n=1 Tax=Vibrio profundum TaxID=2910247 RepID=UPI003D0F2F77